MADKDSPLARIFWLTVTAIAFSFLLVATWQWTARFSWSSDSWLMAIPIVIIFAGMAAAFGLITIFIARYNSRGKGKLKNSEDDFGSEGPT